MWKYVASLLTQKELRKRILFTIFMLAIYRFATHIPLPIVDKNQLNQFFSNNQLFGLLDIFSGGSLANFSIGFMGVGPFITGSIVMQLLGYVIPSIEALQKEGEQGQQIINQYTRLLTIPFGFIQAFGLISLLKSQGVILSLTPFELLTAIIVSTAVTVFFLWIGELISEQGIGNGVSLIITAGIIAGLPAQIRNTYALVIAGGSIDTQKLIGSLAFIAIGIITVALIVFIQDAIRKIPISYARRVIGRKSLSNVDTYLPIKINAAGVIPIIFALSIIVFPGLIARFVENYVKNQHIVGIAKNIYNFLDPNGIPYGVLYFFLVVIFTYFYTAIIVKPDDISENLQKQSGFIPGIRPGTETTKYLSRIITRLTLPGAIFLGVIAILPFIIQSLTDINTLVLGGTGILIIVSVILETSNQIKSYIVNDKYALYK
jgi:preprotein translocase subunit SecY